MEDFSLIDLDLNSGYYQLTADTWSQVVLALGLLFAVTWAVKRHSSRLTLRKRATAEPQRTRLATGTTDHGVLHWKHIHRKATLATRLTTLNSQSGNQLIAPKFGSCRYWKAL
jgi:hypothetical protein